MNKVDEFAEASSIHGIKYVLSKKAVKSTRFFWSIAFFFSISGFIYYAHSGFYKFIHDPEIVMRAQDRRSLDFPMPAITICSNLFAKDNITNIFTAYKNFNAKTPQVLSQNECKYFVANMHWCQPNFHQLVNQTCAGRDILNINVIENMYKSAYSVDKMFLKCKSHTACFHETIRVFTDFGICFVRNSLSFSEIFNTQHIHDDFKCFTRFKNHSEVLSQWTPEIGYASMAEYPVRAERGQTFIYQPFLEADLKDNLCALKNFRLYFHKPNEIATPFHESIYLNFDEYLEFKTVLQSHRTDNNLRKINPVQRKCYFEGERQLKFFKSYTKAHCEWECYANATLEKCGCVKFSMPRDNNTKICNYKMLGCVLKASSTNCQCLQPCIDLKYTYKIDKTHFNRENFNNLLSPEDIMAWVQITVETEVVEEIENFVSYKLQNFISDFGGLLGLFMGCSLLSIIEIFYYLFNYLILTVNTKINPNRAPPSGTQTWAMPTSQVKLIATQATNNEILATLNSLTRTVHSNDLKIRKIIGEKQKLIEKRLLSLEQKLIEEPC